MPPLSRDASDSVERVSGMSARYYSVGLMSCACGDMVTLGTLVGVPAGLRSLARTVSIAHADCFQRSISVCKRFQLKYDGCATVTSNVARNHVANSRRRVGSRLCFGGLGEHMPSSVRSATSRSRHASSSSSCRSRRISLWHR